MANGDAERTIRLSLRYKRGKPAGTKLACAGDALGRSAAARPDCPLPSEQALENAQNGKGQLLV